MADNNIERRGKNVKYLIISCSLHPTSRSRALAELVLKNMKSQEHEVDFINLQDYELPICDGHKAYDDENVKFLSEKIADVDGIILTTPIYNYDANSVAKNLIELTGKAWTDKIVGFACAAGGKSSYMSLMGLANSLMLDFRSTIVPRFVYAEQSAFNEQSELIDPEISNRLEGLSKTVVRFAEALAN